MEHRRWTKLWLRKYRLRSGKELKQEDTQFVPKLKTKGTDIKKFQNYFMSVPNLLVNYKNTCRNMSNDFSCNLPKKML